MSTLVDRSRQISPRDLRSWGSIARHVVLAVFAVITLFPFIWILLLSVKSLPESNQNEIWPQTFDFSHYFYSVQSFTTLPQNYLNSVIVTAGTIVITTVCAVLAGYAMVFLRPPGIALVFTLLVASMFFPTRITAVIAIFEMQKDMGLLNVPAGLIFPYVSLALALSVFIMRGMFLSVSHEIYDAARLDGAGPLRILLSILLPMVTNGIVVVIILTFGTAWGEYVLAKTLNTKDVTQTLPVALSTGAGGMVAWSWPRLAAVYIMVVLPGLIAFAIAQR
ncbi:MAG TPA: carbohydrate ABC transporter permease [Thermomicrobiales bacterium]|nr:carbohydrate ABC transporter permease [Thermomicrobiales bacterium]